MNSRAKFVSVLTLLLFSFFISSSFYSPKIKVFAQTANANDKCHPIDLVILIDQSESMKGSATSVANDVDGQRFDAAVHIADYLATHSAWLCAESGVQHRIAVVGFGDLAMVADNGPDNPYTQDTKVYLPSTIIPNDELNNMTQKELTEAWNSERERIESQIRSGANESLGATDHRSGFLAASDILSDWQDQPLGDLVRRQAVIMITDGEPCIANRGCPPQTYSLTVELMGDLKDITDPLRDEFPYYGIGNPESIYISTIFLSRRAVQDVSWDMWEDITQAHGGNVFPVENSDLLVKVINDALDPVTGSGREPLECGEAKWIRPYLDNVIVFYTFPIVENPQGQAVLNIEADGSIYGLRGGVPITGGLTVDDYFTFHGNERYVFDVPPPGKYYVTVPGLKDCTDELSLSVESTSISGEVISPSANIVLPSIVDEPYYSTSLNSNFILEVLDRNGDPLEEINGYPLAVTATVRNGNYEKVYELEEDTNGRYISNSPIETPLSGDYSWELVAMVRHPNPDELDIEVFEDKGTFRATAVELLNFAIESPNNEEIKPLNTVRGISQIPESLEVVVNVLDTKGDELDVTSVLENWNDLFKAELSSGTISIETINLQLDPTTKNRFVGEFNNGSIDNLPKPGQFTIRVETDWGGSENYNELNYAPAILQSSVTIEQFEIKPLQLELIPPQEPSVHQADDYISMFLKKNGLQPFPIEAQIVDPLNGNTPLFLDDVLNSSDGFEVVVETPLGITQTVLLTPSRNASDQLLIGTGGELLDESGEYLLSIKVNDNQLQEEYAWAQTAYEASFDRKDKTYTNPTTWSVVQAGVVLLICLFFAWLAYIFSGGPKGSLIIIDTNAKAELVTLKLSKYRRVKKFKRPVLKQVGIERIVARKGSENCVAIDVKMSDGLDAPIGDLEPGDTHDVGDAEIRYQNEQASTASYDDFE